MMVRKRRWRWLAGALGVLVLLVGLGAVLVYRGTLWPNRWFAADYAVRGVDVSNYQGDIDWATLASQDIDFAYLKATEGSGHVDARFAANWAGATATDLAVGAYHFFSFDSDASTQAENIIATVPREAGRLPIAIDIELYGPHANSPPSAIAVDAQLRRLIELLTTHYGTHPVLYATSDTYDRYLAGRFGDNPIWIRSVLTAPQLSDGRDWTLWQYSHRDRLDGYTGSEQYIDMNVFAGTAAELARLGQS